jgi:Na+/proline symporter
MTAIGSLLMEMSHSIHYIDYLVVCFYIVYSIIILASYATQVTSQRIMMKSNSVDEQYLAGKSLNLLGKSMFSSIATEVSALTFIGIPAYAYTGDFSFIQVYFGAIWGRIIIAKVILPRTLQ